MPTLVHTCNECDSQFQLKYDIEKCESDPTYCPFCGEYILESDSIQDEDE
jgi:NAD-dependent SIR2 family protein deacetylase